MKTLTVGLISGIMLGIEFERDELGPYLVIDLFILRIGIAWE